MQFWTFLHILSMFSAVTIVIGAEWWVTYAIRRRDLGALRAYFRVSGRAEAAGGILLIVGIAFGLIAAMVIGFDLLQGWLVLAYILVGATLVLGGVNSPYLKQVRNGVTETDGDEPGPELTKLLESKRSVVVAVLDFGIIASIIAVMVFKPVF
jgi:uncharacterized membrane protein